MNLEEAKSPLIQFDCTALWDKMELLVDRRLCDPLIMSLELLRFIGVSLLGIAFLSWCYIQTIDYTYN